ncbi:MAG: ABC transporter substrate-binding protein [Brevundimonas sp.]|nr:MAG: ABC transporter substrate-binding protein [Brevundimonas sp.]
MTSRGAPPLLPRRSLLVGAAAVAATGVGAFACTRNAVQPDESGLVRLRFALDGPAGVMHGGFYQAVASQAYARRGLNVQIIQGADGVNVAQQLANGAVELGLGLDSYTALNLVAEGAPVKAVAAYFQKDPHALVAHPGPALDTPADLRGQPILVPDADRDTVWAWLKARYGLTDAQARRDTGDLKAFTDDPRAVILGGLLTTPARIQAEADTEPRVMLLADEGYAAYAGLVLAPDAFARDNARALRAFVAGSAEGWRDYIRGDGRAADALIRQVNPAMTQAHLDQTRTTLRQQGLVDGGDAALYGLGAMTDERWRDAFEAAARTGFYPQDLDWRRAYTNQYLPGRG